MFEQLPQGHVEGSPEVEIAGDMVRRALPVAPLLILVCGLIWGVDGALSSAYGIALVLLNFVLAAVLLARAARVSPTMLMAATLGGFLLRMTLIVAAVLLVRHTSWAVMAPMLTTILVTHVGLLMWETRYVSLSLAYPGVKPTARKGA
ncbi:MAG TPA: ATP synthase subunit I [Acidimicrobiales bacterium]|nr:ATP synthase subunit I [Acidimicrobiales bacterium]